MIKILLADDHQLILRGLRDLFDSCPDLRVIGTECQAHRVVDEVARLKPDVLLLDLMMPGMSGMEIIHQVAQSHPDTRIVVLSMHADVAYVWEALRQGALGYMLKNSESEELIDAIRKAGGGRRYLCSSIPEQELNNYGKKLQQLGVEPLDMLTRRERQVLRLVAEGNTSASIAEQLEISIRTVETYRANLLRKLNLRNQAEMVRYAIQHGLVLSV